MKDFLVQRDNVNDVLDEESNDLSVYKAKNNYVVANYTTLRDIVRSSIAEEIVRNNLIFVLVVCRT